MSDETSPVDETREPDAGRPAETGSSEADAVEERDAATTVAADATTDVADAGARARTRGLSIPDANVLRSGTRLKVRRAGMVRQDLEGESAEGHYVSQFDSPVHGRMVVVHLPGRGNFGFRLDELQRVEA